MANTKKYVSLDKLGLYDEKIKGVISAGDAAALKAAKDYADSLAPNYDAAGVGASEAAKVQAELDKEILRAKGREDEIAGLVATAQDEVDALELVVDTKANASDLTALSNKVGVVPEGSTVMGIINNIQENAYDDTELRGLITGLDTNKADKTQVALDIAAAVKVEEEARIAAVSGVQGAVDTLSGTHATDKAELEGKIALKADQTSLDAVSLVANAAVKQADYDVKVKALEDEDVRIAGLVSAEAERAAGVEAGIVERLVEVETFFKTVEGETIDEAMDTLVEIQKYITEDGAAADQMVKDIAANKKAIEDHVAVDHDFAGADAALKSELEGKINVKADSSVVEGIDGRLEVVEGKVEVVEGKVSTLEGQMTAVQGAVATKAEAQALADAVAVLEGVDTGLGNRIAALEAKHGDGEGTVESLIATAKQEAIDAAAADATQKDTALETSVKGYVDGKIGEVNGTISTLQGVVDGKAAQSEVNTISGKVGTLETKVETLEGKMTAVEALAAANKSAHEANAAAIALKASQADLEAVSGRVATLETWHNNFTEVSEQEINDLFKA